MRRLIAATAATILLATPTMAQKKPKSNWVKIGEIPGMRSGVISEHLGYVFVSYIDLNSIKKSKLDFTYLISHRKTSYEGKFIDEYNDWSNAKPGTGNCAEFSDSELRMKIIAYACKGVFVPAMARQEKIDESVYRKRVDPFNDQTNITVVWKSKDRGGADIVIRCNAGKYIEAYIDTDTYNSDDVQVKIRWDYQDPYEAQWNKAKSGGAFFAPSAPSFMNELLSSQRLAFGWTPYQETSKSAVFELTKLHPYLNKMKTEGTCMGLL